VGEIRLGDTILKSKSEGGGYYGVFIDSGSTFTYLPRGNYNTMLQTLENACSKYA
jgi:hypothetical protein